mmetsp:Transcript_30902/g.46852  ORF Transcript_30902/g.46852 Transcript_30902/m.46852 type:complete len:269 (-) Transcript_30902:61-867(-)
MPELVGNDIARACRHPLDSRARHRSGRLVARLILPPCAPPARLRYQGAHRLDDRTAGAVRSALERRVRCRVALSRRRIAHVARTSRCKQVMHVTSARVQLLGRLLLPAMHLYYAGRFLFSALALNKTTSLATYVSSLSMFVVRAVALVAFAIGSAFIAAGLKSRLDASLLALVNIGCVFHQHPFVRFVRFENGKWEYDEDMAMPRVALPTDISPDDFYLRQVYDLHRYYFFLGLSTSGALLLLAQFGPGKIAVHKDEVLLPVAARAQD